MFDEEHFFSKFSHFFPLNFRICFFRETDCKEKVRENRENLLNFRELTKKCEIFGKNLFSLFPLIEGNLGDSYNDHMGPEIFSCISYTRPNYCHGLRFISLNNPMTNTNVL